MEYAGNYNGINGHRDRIRAELKKTCTYKKFVRNQIPTDREDVELLVAIVTASQRKLQQMYAGIDFHIILWDNTSPKRAKHELHDWLYAILKQKGSRIHPVNRILPGYLKKRACYELSPEDEHSNALA